MSKTCYKKPIPESLGFVYSKLEKIALKAKKAKKSVIKQFRMNGNTFSVVIVKNDPSVLLMYFISTFKIKQKYWTDLGLDVKLKFALNIWKPMQLHWGSSTGAALLRQLGSSTGGIHLEDLIRAVYGFVKILRYV